AVGTDDRVHRAGLDPQADAVHRGQRAEGLDQILRLEDRHDQKRDQASTTPPRKKRTTATKATPRSSGQRAHSVLTDSESQRKRRAPMSGPKSEPLPPISVANTTLPEATKPIASSGTMPKSMA